MNESEILRATKKGNTRAVMGGATNKDASFVSSNSQGGRGKSSDQRKTSINNEWIPTEAVRVL